MLIVLIIVPLMYIPCVLSARINWDMSNMDYEQSPGDYDYRVKETPREASDGLKDLDKLIEENLIPFKMPHEQYEEQACEQFCKAFGMIVAQSNEDYKMHYTVCENYCKGDTFHDRNMVIECRSTASKAFLKALEEKCGNSGCNNGENENPTEDDAVWKECISTCKVVVNILMTLPEKRNGGYADSTSNLDKYTKACSVDCKNFANKSPSKPDTLFAAFQNSIPVFKAGYNKCFGLYPPNGKGPSPFRVPFWPGPGINSRKSCFLFCEKIAETAFKNLTIGFAFSSYCTEYCKDEMFYDDYRHWKVKIFENCRKPLVPKATSDFDRLCKVAEGMSNVANCDKHRHPKISCTEDCKIGCIVKGNLLVNDHRTSIYVDDCCFECVKNVTLTDPKLFVDEINQDYLSQLESCYLREDKRVQPTWWP